MEIRTDSIQLNYTCPECQAIGYQLLSAIVECGTAVCSECGADMDLDEFVSIRK